MKEIWRMWKLVRLFYKNRMVLASRACKEDSKDKFDSRIKERVITEFEKKMPDLPTEDARNAALEGIHKKVRTDMEKHIDMFIESDFFEYNQEARVNRHDLAEMYLQEREIEPNIFSIKDNREKEKNRITRIEYNSIVDSCIDKENGYIKKCGEDSKKIYLTAEGKKFAGIDGLLKAEIKEIGILTSTILAIIGTATATNFGWVLQITGYISPWW